MIRFYLSESFKSIKNAKLASLITTITLSISIGFIALTLILLFLSSQIERKWKSEIKMNVFLSDSLSTSEISDIKGNLLSYKIVRNANYISKKEARKKFIQLTGDDFKTILDINPLPNSFAVSFNPDIDQKKISNILTEFSTIEGVDEVIYDYNLTLTLLDFLNSMKIIIYLFTFIFVLISFYLLYSTSKLFIIQKKTEFNTMKLVGAKLSTVKIPLLITGLIFGILASFICIVIYNLGILAAKEFYGKLRFENYIFSFNFILLILGILLGPIGTGLFTKTISLRIEKFN